MRLIDRSEVIRQSVSVLIYGFVGLLPLIGLFPAVSAVIQGMRIRRAYPASNPVDHYRKLGMVLGSVCIFLNLCVVLIVIKNLFDAANRGDWM